MDYKFTIVLEMELQRCIASQGRPVRQRKRALLENAPDLFGKGQLGFTI